VDSYYDIGPSNYTFVNTRDLGTRRLRGSIRPQSENITINRIRNRRSNIVGPPCP